ncbi:alpha/beta fold hydrolase [Variovorax rhizosphaerae]|uniref:Alpha/beta fold hydrolase n=1 Tax=Variovorax rhizosphaerae TaxID=1836200 RepID=A0ABU8WH96_9BURK
MLALHSIGLDAHSFDALREAVGPDWRITSFDQRGHGAQVNRPATSLEQYVDDAALALAECSDGPVHLLGHSMGGAVAALLAARTACGSPGRIATLTLISSPSRGMLGFTERAAAVRADGVRAAVAPTMFRWFGEEGAALDNAPQSYARSTLNAMQSEGFAGAWEALAQFPGYDDIADLLPPTLCITAADDLSTPPHAMQPIVEAFKKAGRADNVAFTTLASGGHMAPLFAAPELVGALRVHWLAHTVQPSSKH